MTTDAADAGAEVLVAFWGRSKPLDLRTRQRCERLAALVDPEGSLAAAALAAPEGSAPRVAAALARATDPEIAGLVRQIARAPAAAGGEQAARPRTRTQDVDVNGNHNFVVTVGRDLLMGERIPSEEPGSGAGPPPPRASPSAPTELVLVVAADPVDQERLQLGMEAREIREALRRSAGRSQWTVDTWSAARFGDLSQALLDHLPRVVHFSGHGSEGGLLLEDESGFAREVPREALTELFAEFAETVECVVLNACYSEPQARAISSCVPFVIGSPSTVLDTAAIRFSAGFYQALGAGRSVPKAYRMGCAHFRGKDNPGDPPPVLIARPPR